MAHNHEVIRSKRISGIYHHIAMVHQGTGATNPNRDGAEEARGAHNSEVLGSNPSSGIFPIQKGGSAPLKPPLCRAGVEGFEGALDAPSSVALQKLLGDIRPPKTPPRRGV